jgi:hypothetical protein
LPLSLAISPLPPLVFIEAGYFAIFIDVEATLILTLALPLITKYYAITPY